MKVVSISANQYVRVNKNRKFQNAAVEQKSVVYSRTPVATKPQNSHLLLGLYSMPYFVSFGNKTSSDSENSYLSKINSFNTPEETKNYLNNVINSDYERENFIDELTSNPAKSKEIVQLLKRKLGGEKKFSDWYLDKNGYVENYEKYLNTKYKNATSVDELLKIQPNWGYWAFERKQADIDFPFQNVDNLMRDMNINFNFGSIPYDLCSKSDFSNICNVLKNSEFGIRNKGISTVNGYIIADQLSGGDKSAKNIYKLRTTNGNKYILKTDRFYPEDKLENESNRYIPRFAKETKLLKGDAVYLDACIDRYLDLNGIKSNAKLLYYDFKNNAALYEYVEGSEPLYTGKKGNVDAIEANRLFEDINDVGVYINDIGLQYNCQQDDKGNYRITDIGHSEYVDLLKPGAKDLTIETSNFSGFSYKNFFAGLGKSNQLNLNQEKLDFIWNLHSDLLNLNNENKSKIAKSDGYHTTSSLLARCSLIESYISDILLRNTGFASGDKDIIAETLEEINRNLTFLKKYAEDENIQKKCEVYEQFLQEYKEGKLCNKLTE